MTRPIVVDATRSYFSYSAQTNPSPLIASPATDPPSENKGALQIAIIVPATGSFTVESITFTVDVGTTDALMQNSDDLQLTAPDATWSFGYETLSETQVLFTLMGQSSNPVLTGTTLFVEIANFITVQQACSTTIAIAETLQAPPGQPALPVGQATVTIATFAEGFFFEALGAWTTDGSAPVAEVANGTQVQLQWNASAVGTGIEIFMSGQSEPIVPEDMGSWTTPAGLTEDTVFTVSATQGNMVLSQSVAVTVASPDITASSVTVNGPLTLVGGMKPGQSGFFPTNFTSQGGGEWIAVAEWVASADGFVSVINEGWMSGNVDGALGMVIECAGTIQFSYATVATTTTLLVPVFAGQPITFQLAIYGEESLPPSITIPGEFTYISFGNGTIALSNGPIAERREQLRARSAERFARRSRAAVLSPAR